MKIRIETLPPVRVAYLRMKGMGPATAELFGKLDSWYNSIKTLHKHPQYVWGLYWLPESSPVPEQACSDACVMVPNDFELSDSSEIQFQTIEGGKYIITTVTAHKDNHDAFEKLWQQSYAEFQNSGVDFRNGPCLEVYYNNPLKHPYDNWVLDMCCPIK